MVAQLSYMQRTQIAEKARKRFVEEAERMLVDLGGLLQDRLTTLLGEKGLTREMQERRDSWMLFQQLRNKWIDATMKAWQDALRPAAARKPEKKTELSLEGDGGLSLVGNDAVENKILVSRLAMSIAEKVSQPFDDLRVRMKTLESRDDLDAHDILRPEELIHHMVEQWVACGMPRSSWTLVNDVVLRHLIERLKTAYTNGNEFLIQQGVMPTIDLKDRVKRAAVGRRPPVGAGGGPDSVQPPDSQFPADAGAGWGSSSGGWGPSSGYSSQPGAYGSQPAGMAPAYGAAPAAGGYAPPPPPAAAVPPAGAGAYAPPPPAGYGPGYGSAPGPAPAAPGYGPGQAGYAPMAPGAPAGYGAPAGPGGPAAYAPVSPAAPGGPMPAAGAVPGQAGAGGGAAPAAGGRAPGQLFGGRLGWDVPPAAAAARSQPLPAGAGAAAGAAPLGQTPAQIQQTLAAQAAASLHGGIHEETRLMTQTTPLARTRSRAQGMFGQLKRLLIGQGVGDFSGTAAHPPSPALAAAIAQPVFAAASGGSGTVFEDYGPAAVGKAAEKLREKTEELKQKAETKSEKAIIEMVALMFQAILAEERIPSTVRVWFARLQMPVLRVALAEPEFFGTLDHPARQLIDRMGSCVLGFDASGISGSALEAEIKRIVQVIEQYPETGKRVFQIVYDEFQKFLSRYLTGKDKTQKVVSVAQQVEQKETLTIQYTIELRNLLKDMPVRDEIRTFLFKVWAEVLAVSAVRKGPKDVETVALKKAAADLVWSASAKPNRNDRARVIQDLPQLLQRLRAGMGLLGMPQSEQDAHIKIVSDTMADAFMSKTQAIPQAQIDALAQRLANLEDFVSDDGLGDLPLDAESIEMMLGIEASSITVVTDGGSKPTPAMVAWAQELQPGAWFTLDHNGKVTPVQFVWRSERKQLNLFAASDGHSYLIQAGRLAAYLQAGLLLPQEEETLTVRATREALTRLEANPERLVA